MIQKKTDADATRITLITDTASMSPCVWSFTHFFRVFAPLFLAGFLKMKGVVKTCVKKTHQNRLKYVLVLTDSKILHLFWCA